MTDRSELVGMMLKAVRQIAAHEAFAQDAMWCAEMVQGAENDAGAAALRAMVVSRRIEIAAMRKTVRELATVLAAIPLEAA